VKLAAAIGAWLGPSGSWRASLVAAAVGGFIAALILFRERRAREVIERILMVFSTRSMAPLPPPSTRTQSRGQPMPYGIAIAAGAFIMAWMPGVFS
jgi:Flp pilus assembly protein protease CpaA